MNTIIVKDLCKEINGKIILKNINMSLNGGVVYGLKGKNGSGKTMLIRTLAGLIKPSGGSYFTTVKNCLKIGILFQSWSYN
jgi:ABC-2 type transport system ATP-binding protein